MNKIQQIKRRSDDATQIPVIKEGGRWRIPSSFMTSLFSNVPVLETMEIIDDEERRPEFCPIPPDNLWPNDLLLYCTSNLQFLFNGICRIEGLAMDSALGPFLAISLWDISNAIFLMKLKANQSNKLEKKPIFFQVLFYGVLFQTLFRTGTFLFGDHPDSSSLSYGPSSLRLVVLTLRQIHWWLWSSLCLHYQLVSWDKCMGAFAPSDLLRFPSFWGAFHTVFLYVKFSFSICNDYICTFASPLLF